MSAHLKIDPTCSIRNNDVGSFTGILTGLSIFKTDEPLESNVVEIGGFEWMLRVEPVFEGGVLDMLQIYLLSCNEVTISSYVRLIVLWQGQTEDDTTPRELKTAIPFHSIVKTKFDPTELADSQNSGLDDRTLLITADFRDIRKAKKREETKAWRNMHTIYLNVIDNFSIRETLNQGSDTTIVLSQNILSQIQRDSDLCSGSLVRLWARQDLDHRYWRCQSLGEQHVRICECLNEAPVNQELEDICVPDKRGSLWVTVFREKKESKQVFQPLNENTILVFCLAWDPNYNDASSYCGHLLVQNTMPFYILSEKLAEKAGISDAEDCFVHVCNGMSKAFKPRPKAKLRECGVHSGSVCIVEKLPKNQGSRSGGSSDHQIQNQPDSGVNGKGDGCPNRSNGEDPKCSPLNLDPSMNQLQQTNTQNTIPCGSSPNANAVNPETGLGNPACPSPNPSTNVVCEDVPQIPETPVRKESSVFGDSAAKKDTQEIAKEENSLPTPESEPIEGRTASGLVEAKQELLQAKMTASLERSISNEIMSGIHLANKDKAQQLKTNASSSIYVKVVEVVIDTLKEFVNQEQNYDNPKMLDPVSTDIISKPSKKDASSEILDETPGEQRIGG